MAAFGRDVLEYFLYFKFCPIFYILSSFANKGVSFVFVFVFFACQKECDLRA